MAYWKDEVLLFLRDLSPPAFMWHPGPAPDLRRLAAYPHIAQLYNRMERLLEERNGTLKSVTDHLRPDTSRPAVIQRQYEQIRRSLEEGGYGDLSRMADRIETRLPPIKDELETLESRVLYLNAQQRAYQNRYVEIASSTEEGGSQVSNSQGETPIGKALLEENDEPEPQQENAWEVDPGTGDVYEEVLESTKVSYHPTDDEVDPDVRVFATDFDSTHLFSHDTLVFTADTTWNEVFEEFENRLQSLRNRKDKLRKTRDLLDFRREIVETVLYQVEAFGAPKKMSKRYAKQIAGEQLPDIFEGHPTLRSHAAEIVDKYRDNPSSLPEDMGPFKENWVPSDKEAKGASKVAQLQRAMRKAHLSDEYTKPETFCDLLERLVERHDTAS